MVSLEVELPPCPALLSPGSQGADLFLPLPTGSPGGGATWEVPLGDTPESESEICREMNESEI